jgi:glycosyltransferase involved in cell wall biosynthesis
MNSPRFAILSHVLPPSPSGQSVMLYRILSGLNPDKYYLVSREIYDKKGDGKFFLPVEYFNVSAPNLFHLLNKLKMPQPLRDLIYFIILALSRVYKLIRLVRRNPVYAIVACSGDLVDIPAGYIVSRLLGVKFYAYLFDDYVYQWVGFQRLIARLMASWIFKNSEGLIGPNEYLCEEYQRRYNTRYVIARNPCDPYELNLLPNIEWPSETGKIKILYTGAIYYANYDCFRNLVHAMNMIIDYQLDLYIYTAQTAEQLEAHGIGGGKVHVYSHVLYNQILEEQHKADILFLPLAFQSPIPEVLRTSAPGKMGEYLASGRPVLAHVPPDSFVKYYLKKYQCGIVADKNSPDNLAEHILNLMHNVPLRLAVVKNALERARFDFDPRISQENLINFLSSELG